jgi:RHS repeat-associated protein
VVEKYTYDAYGTPVIRNASGAILTASAITNPHMFTGRRLDSETGLYHYRNRVYSPVIGRFLQRDPIGYFDSMNLFQYVGNSPLNWLDPFGLTKGGKQGIGGSDPLMNPNKIDDLKKALKDPNLSKARKNALKAWLKVFKRGGSMIGLGAIGKIMEFLYPPEVGAGEMEDLEQLEQEESLEDPIEDDLKIPDPLEEIESIGQTPPMCAVEG